MLHRNARLTVYGRLQIVRRRAEGHTAAGIAAMMGVSRATVHKWLRRYAEGGAHALADRPSKPHALPHALPGHTLRRVCALRRSRAWGPHRIAYALQMPRSTVYGILRRHELHRLALLDRSTREVIRYERAAPGELLHLDVKKLGRIPEGGGKRFHPGFRENHAGRRVGRGIGHDFIHVAVDDYSRYAYAEALPDERGDTTAAFLARALAVFTGLGVRVQRVLTDNGANYRSHAVASVAGAHAVQLKRTRPYRPQTNGKAEAFNKTLQREWAYVRRYRSNAERTAALNTFLDDYNRRRPHTALGGLVPLKRVCQ